jgi:hypothetical protein
MEEIDRWSLDGFDGHPAGVKQRPLCCAHATIVVLKDALELAQKFKKLPLFALRPIQISGTFSLRTLREPIRIME